MSSTNKKISTEKKMLKKVGWFALKTVGLSAAILGGVAIAVPALGFTAGGVAAGSLAAAYQSTLGGVIASGSAFAVLQSVGAAGLAATTQAAVVAGSAAVAGAHTIAKTIKKENDNEEETDTDDEKDTNKNSNTDKKPSKLSQSDGNSKDISSGQKIVAINFEKKAAYKNKETNTQDASLKFAEHQNVSLRKSDDLTGNSELEQIATKWKDVQLTDDVRISKIIFKNAKRITKL